MGDRDASLMGAGEEATPAPFPSGFPPFRPISQLTIYAGTAKYILSLFI